MTMTALLATNASKMPNIKHSLCTTWLRTKHLMFSKRFNTCFCSSVAPAGYSAGSSAARVYPQFVQVLSNSRFSLFRSCSREQLVSNSKLSGDQQSQ